MADVRMCARNLLLLLSLLVMSSSLTFTDCPFHHLQHFEQGISSHTSGTDGVLAATFSILGVERGNFVDVSPVEDRRSLKILRDILYFESLLPDKIFMNGLPSLESIEELFLVHDVPVVFDILVLEYGMSTWWVLASILKMRRLYRPRTILVEVNSMLGCRDEYDRFAFHRVNSYPLVSEYDENSVNVSSAKTCRYYGANPLAYKVLLNSFGYALVHCESVGIYCLFVKQDIMPKACPFNFPLSQLTYPVFRINEDLLHNPLYVCRSFLQNFLNSSFKVFSLTHVMKELCEIETINMLTDLKDAFSGNSDMCDKMKLHLNLLD